MNRMHRICDSAQVHRTSAHAKCVEKVTATCAFSRQITAILCATHDSARCTILCGARFCAAHDSAHHTILRTTRFIDVREGMMTLLRNDTRATEKLVGDRQVAACSRPSAACGHLAAACSHQVAACGHLPAACSHSVAARGHLGSTGIPRTLTLAQRAELL